MHFRIRRHVVQLVRMTYDPSIKRGKAQVVGSVKLADPMLSDELREKLTADEATEFELWVSTNHRANLLKQELAALTLAEQMDQARLWFERQDEQGVAQQTANELLRHWQALRRVLKQRELLD
ncbi:hypothetical protein [Halomonas huangheensis]|uniref:Uncharacterized protein n=1 Tax=Halomonas huangheensis TaxID=1178482 RepID=W1N9Y8_9GAMM|nr:hypothetical protein [Halomonas huangheensis]ALM53724.1 hypothetical protein AR456_16665 [Halomonas huangheensis]ERL52362.1 hypothetical protein BJB45_10370 [Halomonas huangheensis]